MNKQEEKPTRKNAFLLHRRIIVKLKFGLVTFDKSREWSERSSIGDKITVCDRRAKGFY